MGFSLPHHGSPKEPEEAPSPPSGLLPFLDPLEGEIDRFQMSACGTKRTSVPMLSMSALRGKADIE